MLKNDIEERQENEHLWVSFCSSRPSITRVHLLITSLPSLLLILCLSRHMTMFGLIKSRCTFDVGDRVIMFSCLRRQRPSLPLAHAVEEEEAEKTCGPTGIWEALTPCNGCHNLGFSGLSQVKTHNMHLHLRAFKWKKSR